MLDPAWLNSGIQHHRLALGPRPSIHIHDLHRVCTPTPDKRPTASTCTLESWTVRNLHQRFWPVLLGVHYRYGMLSDISSSGLGVGELGATGVGCGDDIVGGGIFRAWQEALYSTCGVRRRAEGRGCWVAVVMTRWACYTLRFDAGRDEGVDKKRGACMRDCLYILVIHRRL